MFSNAGNKALEYRYDSELLRIEPVSAPWSRSFYFRHSTLVDHD